MSEVTRILSQIDQGDAQAAEQLLPLIYDELRKLAKSRLAQEKDGQTLQPTALVHEAYLRLIEGQRAELGWSRDENRQLEASKSAGDFHSPTSARFRSRGHFFAAAAEAMRRILVEQARRKHAIKRGGGRARATLDDGMAVLSPDDSRIIDLVALDDALAQLEAAEPLKAQLVKLRYFAGLSSEEAAAMLGISARTARRHWIYARSWLYGKLHGE